MSRATWFNRGSALGLVVSVLFGAVGATGVCQQKVEQPKKATPLEIAPPPHIPEHLETLADKMARAQRECQALAAAVDAYIAHPKNPKREPPTQLEDLLRFPSPDRPLLEERALTDPCKAKYQVKAIPLGDDTCLYLFYTRAPDATTISQFGIGDKSRPKD